MEYIGKRFFFLGWFIVQVQEILVLPWLTTFRETARRKTVILGDLGLSHEMCSDRLDPFIKRGLPAEREIGERETRGGTV